MPVGKAKVVKWMPVGPRVRGQGILKYNLIFFFFTFCQHIVAQMDTLITSEKSLKIFRFLSQQFNF